MDYWAISQIGKNFDWGDGDMDELESGEAALRWGVQQLGGSDGTWEGDGGGEEGYYQDMGFTP